VVANKGVEVSGFFLMDALGRRRLFGALAALLAAAAAVLLFVLPATAGGREGDRLDAVVVANNRGPLPACAQDQATARPPTQSFISSISRTTTHS